MTTTPRRALALAALASALAVPAVHAQTSAKHATTQEVEHLDSRPSPGQFPVETIRLHNISSGNQGTDILTAIRYLIGFNAKLYYDVSQQAILFSGPPDQVAAARQIVAELDKPAKAYRLTFTVRELDGSRVLGTQHYATTALAGEHATLKEGSRVPIITGATGTPAPSTQYQYIDIGINLDSTLTEIDGGAILKLKAEQSSIPETKSILGTTEPIIRQTVFEGTSLLTLGKPRIVGSADIPATTRRLEFEVLMEPAS